MWYQVNPGRYRGDDTRLPVNAVGGGGGGGKEGGEEGPEFDCLKVSMELRPGVGVRVLYSGVDGGGGKARFYRREWRLMGCGCPLALDGPTPMNSGNHLSPVSFMYGRVGNDWHYSDNTLFRRPKTSRSAASLVALSKILCSAFHGEWRFMHKERWWRPIAPPASSSLEAAGGAGVRSGADGKRRRTACHFYCGRSASRSSQPLMR